MAQVSEHGTDDQVKPACKKGVGGWVVMRPGSMEERSLDKMKKKKQI